MQHLYANDAVRAESFEEIAENQTPSGQNKLGPSSARAKLRSKTYAGIAAAMAEQWGRVKQ